MPEVGRESIFLERASVWKSLCCSSQPRVADRVNTIGNLLPASGRAKAHLFKRLDQYLGEISFDKKGLSFAQVQEELQKAKKVVERAFLSDWLSLACGFL